MLASSLGYLLHWLPSALVKLVVYLLHWLHIALAGWLPYALIRLPPVWLPSALVASSFCCVLNWLPPAFVTLCIGYFPLLLPSTLDTSCFVIFSIGYLLILLPFTMVTHCTCPLHWLDQPRLYSPVNTHGVKPHFSDGN